MTHELLFTSLALGYILDLLFGDPENFPHPIRVFGRVISIFEKLLNTGTQKKIKGLIIAVILPTSTFIIFFGIESLLLNHANDYMIIAYGSTFVFYGLANKSLISEGKNVLKGLNESLKKGRFNLSRIVGRDTDKLNAQEIQISVLETLSENLSDGVVAPLFFLAIGGIPGMMTYKMVNTLDSMVGYKTKKFLEFGWASAKLDDVLNFIPARITAILIALISFNQLSFKFIWKFGKAHASPNAGYPEAALAGTLDCKFGGPNYYHGELMEKPQIGINNKTITSKDLHLTFKINHAVALVTVIIILAYFAGLAGFFKVFYG